MRRSSNKRAKHGIAYNAFGKASPRRHSPAGSMSPRTKPLAAPVLITGGAGFIGTNVAHRLLSSGQRVLLYDNLSRPGVEQNLMWLQATHGALVQIEIGDIQDLPRLRKVVQGSARVFHLAAQVAVTGSLTDPLLDFEINARGTLNLLEALRELAQPPPLIFTSTNKVYGNLKEVSLRRGETRYEPEREAIRLNGFDEKRPLDFHSPYGCSKGAAEQYVLDYARTFGLPALVFRMSCIYGPHQFGNEDQGWVAHFLIRALENRQITVYGDGRQVRDILFIDDLVDAFLLALEQMEGLAGHVFNMGGGPANTISLLELLDLISQLEGRQPLVRFDDWRAADQPYYVSDTRKFSALTGWSPKVSVRQGIEELHGWLGEVRAKPLLPIILPAPALVANGRPNGHGPSRDPKTKSLRVPKRELRSKRFPRMTSRPREALARKIIKFP
jgi:CDP-paratose 2-epimerase